jgi:hypothetical protein
MGRLQGNARARLAELSLIDGGVNMRNTRNAAGLGSLLLLPLLLWSLPAQAQTPGADETLVTAEGVVAELYDLVTFDAGTTPDWDRARSLFLPEAVVVLRTGRETTAQFTVEGWVADFENFIEHRDVVETGFIEGIVNTKAWVFKDIAHVLVLYEAGFPNDERRQYGIDSFHLIRRDGRWWIAGILNEVPDRDNPIPAELRP